jgi:hypothetical protein
MPSALSRLLLLVALAVAGCGGGPIFDQVSATLPPVPAGEARIFVYRDYEPYQSLSWVPVFFNGATIGAVGPGHVLMRDVPPGTYKIEPKSEGLWPDQAKTVRVAAGDSVFAKIESFNGLDDTGASDLQTTFVVVLVDPVAARREIGPLWYDVRLTAGRAVALSDETALRGGLRLCVPKTSWRMPLLPLSAGPSTPIAAQ